MTFKNFLLSLLVLGEEIAPIFIKSQHGIVVLNASEAVVNQIVQATQVPDTPPSAPLLTGVTAQLAAAAQLGSTIALSPASK